MDTKGDSGERDQQSQPKTSCPSIPTNSSQNADTEEVHQPHSNFSQVGQQIGESRTNGGEKEELKDKSLRDRKDRHRSKSKKKDRDVTRSEKKEKKRSMSEKKDKKKKDKEEKKKKHEEKKKEKEGKKKSRSKSKKDRKEKRDDSRNKKGEENSSRSRVLKKESEDGKSRKRDKNSESRKKDKKDKKSGKHKDKKASKSKKESKDKSKNKARSRKRSYSQRHSSSSSASPSSSSVSSRSSRKDKRGRKKSLSPYPYSKKIQEADIRRMEREKRSVGDYFLQLKQAGQEKKNGKQVESKYVDSNDQQIDTDKFFWDGFCWQPRLSKASELDEAFLKSTEKQRKIQLQNVPYHLGLDKIDVISYVNNFMKEKYLANQGSEKPVLSCELNYEDGTANLELSSVEETNLMYKLMSFEFFQNECRIVKLGETNVYQPSIQALTQAAIRQAEAQAAVIKATESFLIGDTTLTEASEGRQRRVDIISPIIKVTNTVALGEESKLSEGGWEDLHADLIEEFQRYGEVIFHFLVRPYQATVGAKAGTLFVEYSNTSSAEEAISVNDGRIFNGLSLKIYSLSEEGFNANFRPLVSIRQ